MRVAQQNAKEWATVKFFFDVINYIEDSPYFNNGDSIIMLDTDCIALNSSADLFTRVARINRPVAFITGNVYSADFLFHGLSISALENFFYSLFSCEITIKDTIGGEFFAFNKNDDLSTFRVNYECIFNDPRGDLITTEEQILTMLNAKTKFVNIDLSIYRIWTAYRNYDVSSDYKRFTFLHLPSEKTTGLSGLFKTLIEITPNSFSSDELDKVIYQHIPLHNPFKLFAFKFINSVKNKISSLSPKFDF